MNDEKCRVNDPEGKIDVRNQTYQDSGRQNIPQKGKRCTL